MASWSPCKRSVFIKKLRRLGFSPPEPGGKHYFMRRGSYTLTLPGNSEYSVSQLRMLLREVRAGAGKELTADEWQEL